MRVGQARWTDLDDPVEWDKKIPNANRPNFFDSNTWTVTHDRPQVKTECAVTDGRAMGSPPGNTMTTPRRAPASHDANTEPSTRTAAYAPSSQNVGQATKRARTNKHGPRATVPFVKVEWVATDSPYTPDTSYDSSPRNQREESPTGAEVTAPLRALTGSDVPPDTALGRPTLGEANTREGSANTLHPSAQPTHYRQHPTNRLHNPPLP